MSESHDRAREVARKRLGTLDSVDDHAQCVDIECGTFVEAWLFIPREEIVNEDREAEG